MEEYDLDECKEYEKAWKCPIDTCMKILTRKQTLQTHLSSIHGVEACKPKKRYKLYDVDESVPVPYSTMQRKRKKQYEEDTGCQNTQDCEINEESKFCEDIHDNYNMEESDVDEVTIYCGEEEQGVLIESSSEDENEHLMSTTKLEDDPPFYVLPPSNNIYQSELTQSKHFLALSAFSTRHNLSDAAVKDLLRLVQLHLPKNNVGETHITEF